MNPQNTLDFLRQSPDHYIEMVRLDNQEYIPNERQKMLFVDNIPNGDLDAYINSYVNNNIDDVVVSVQHRSKSGNSSRKVGNPYGIKIHKKVVAMTVQQNLPAPQAQPEVEVMKPQGLGNPFGLGFPEIMSMSVKAERLEDYKNHLSEAKEEIKDLKQEIRDERNKYEKKINELDNELRSTKTELSQKEREMEMAVKAVENSQKGFLDSPGAEKLLDKLGAIGEAYVSANAGGSTPQGLGMPAKSETKQSFFAWADENCTDDEINYLGAIIGNLGNANFVNELNLLVKKYANS
jgi:flagellar motility protein MotE (MotC chaperone)